MTRDLEFELYFPHGLEVARRSARAVLRLDNEVDDIAAESLTRLYLRWRTVTGSTAQIDAWTARVAINLAIDHVRRQHRRFVNPRQQPMTELPVERWALELALRRLPRRQRTVLALKYLADLPDPQIASALGITVNSVKTHTRRGLGSMRGALTEEHDTC